jgi:hypothetical protein
MKHTLTASKIFQVSFTVNVTQQNPNITEQVTAEQGQLQRRFRVATKNETNRKYRLKTGNKTRR